MKLINKNDLDKLPIYYSIYNENFTGLKIKVNFDTINCSITQNKKRLKFRGLGKPISKIFYEKKIK